MRLAPRFRLCPTLLAVICVTACQGNAPPPATLLVRQARIWTADSANPAAAAIAVRDDRIVWVGDDSAAESQVGPATQVIDAGGRFLMPGFIDSHVHPVSGGLELTQCDLNDIGTLDSMRLRIRACAERAPAGDWILGGGYQQPVFAGGQPTRAFLDSLTGDHPAMLSSSDGHTSWVNSRALSIAGISNSTPDPEGGRIDRDARGAPLGTLRERASRLVSKHVPPTSDAALAAGLDKALERAAQFGITTLFEASASEPFLRAYARADSGGRLTARVVVSLQTSPVEGPEQVQRLAELRARYTRPLVQPIAAKIFADGVLEAGTAAVLEPYVGRPADRGILNMGPESMTALVQALDSAGFKVHIHAIGDRGIRVALDALEAQHRRDGGAGPRHQLVHLQLIDPADIPRFKALGVVASFQALWHMRDAYVRDLTEPRLGKERSARMYPMATMARSGALLAGGSDWSVTSLNPLQAIEVGISRRAPGDTTAPPWIPEEAMSLDGMLRAYTRGGAAAIDREAELGILRPGALADFIVLSDDLRTAPVHRLHAARVLMTVMGGRVVWRDSTIR
jgi:predicted amidohydrolase YtcJ